MASSVLVLTVAESSQEFTLQEDNIVWVVNDSLGSEVWFSKQGAALKKLIVTETRTTMLSTTEKLIAVTRAGQSETMLINADRIIEICDDTLGSEIWYDKEGAYMQKIVVTESRSAIKTDIDAL